MIAGALEIQMSANIARLANDMAKARSDVTGTMKAIENSVASAKNALAGLGVGVGLGTLARQAVILTDEYTKFNAQLRLATGSASEYGRALQVVRGISTASQTNIAQTGVLYARIANATREMGIGEKGVSEITETLALAMKAGGATITETASAMLQLSQAFGSGKLRGEEFNAVNEAAPRVMKALADGMGVPIGKLAEMAKEGKITSEVMAVALPKALAQVRKEAEQVQTIGGAFTVLRNQVMEFVGSTAETSGVIRLVTGAISALANNLDIVGAALIGLTTMKVAQWFAGIVGSIGQKTAALVAASWATQAERAATIAASAADMARAKSTLAVVEAARARAVVEVQETAATIRATAAMGAQSAALAANTAARAANSAAISNLASLGQMQAQLSRELTAAQAAHTAATVAGTGAAGLASRALGLLGGPIGAITTLLGLGATAWALWGSKGQDATNQVAQTLQHRHEEIMKSLKEQIEKMRERKLLAMSGPEGAALAKQETPAAEQLRQYRIELRKLDEAGKASPTGFTVTQIELMKSYGRRIDELTRDMQKLGAETADYERATSESKVPEFWAQFGSKVHKANLAVEEWKGKLKEAFTPEMEKAIRATFEEKGGGGPQDSVYRNLIQRLREQSSEEKKLSEVEKVRLELESLSAKQRAAITPEREKEIMQLARMIDLKNSQAATEKLLEQRRTNELTALKASAAAQQQVSDFALDMNRITVEQHAQAKIALATQVADAEIAAINKTLEAQQAALAKESEGTAGYVTALQAVEATEAKRAEVTRALGATTAQVFQQSERAARDYTRAIEDVRTEIMSLTGDTRGAALRQFDRSKEALLAQAKARVAAGEPGAEQEVADINTARELSALQAEFNQERQKLSDINSYLAIEEERAQNTFRAGAISELELMRRTGAARQAAIAQQEAIVLNLQRIAAEGKNPAIALQAEQAAAALEKLRLEADVVGQKFNEIFTSSAADAFAEFIEGTKTASQAFDSFGDSVVKQINRMVTEALSKQLFEAMGLGGGTNKSGGLIAGLAGILSGSIGGNSAPAPGSPNFIGPMQPSGGDGGGFWGGLAKIGGAIIGSFDTGTPYVPRTGLAMIHQGERIVPAAENARGSRRPVQIHQHFPTGVTRQAAGQAAAEAARRLKRDGSRYS